LPKRRKRKSKVIKTREWHYNRAEKRDGKGWQEFWCPFCHKISWRSRELAENAVREMKADPAVEKPYMLNAYRCPKQLGFHVGNNYFCSARRT
jgi:hypothetical protein